MRVKYIFKNIFILFFSSTLSLLSILFSNRSLVPFSESLLSLKKKFSSSPRRNTSHRLDCIHRSSEKALIIILVLIIAAQKSTSYRLDALVEAANSYHLAAFIEASKPWSLVVADHCLYRSLEETLIIAASRRRN